MGAWLKIALEIDAEEQDGTWVATTAGTGVMAVGATEDEARERCGYGNQLLIEGMLQHEVELLHEFLVEKELAFSLGLDADPPEACIRRRSTLAVPVALGLAHAVPQQ